MKEESGKGQKLNLLIIACIKVPVWLIDRN